jgi:TolA-binding protein
MSERSESGGEAAGRDAPRRDDPLGELAQLLLDNPWVNQALQVAFGARERASAAGASAMRNLNLPTGADVDRLARRLRAVSERLEQVEDSLDEVERQLASLRRRLEERAAAPSSQG